MYPRTAENSGYPEAKCIKDPNVLTDDRLNDALAAVAVQNEQFMKQDLSFNLRALSSREIY
jgi:hypothetical protein